MLKLGEFQSKQKLYTESLGISEQQSNVRRTFNDIFCGYFTRVDSPCPNTNIFKCRKIVVLSYAEARQFHLFQIQCKHTSNILRRILRGFIYWKFTKISSCRVSSQFTKPYPAAGYETMALINVYMKMPRNLGNNFWKLGSNFLDFRQIFGSNFLAFQLATFPAFYGHNQERPMPGPYNALYKTQKVASKKLGRRKYWKKMFSVSIRPFEEYRSHQIVGNQTLTVDFAQSIQRLRILSTTLTKWRRRS